VTLVVLVVPWQHDPSVHNLVFLAYIYITVKTEMLLWLKVCCFSWMLDTRCSCELVTNVVYKAMQCSSIHNCSFMQQTSSHNNISVLGVQTYLICYLFVALFSTHLLVNCLCLACCLCLFTSLFTIYIHKMSHCHCLVFYETIAVYLRLTIFGGYYWSKA